jgi:hypothetical protein
MRFCPLCRYYLFLQTGEGALTVHHVCRNCHYTEELKPKNPEEALILETNFRSGSSAGGAASGITVNEYTLADPTLPHMRGAQAPACPGCATTTAPADRDVIYIKTDPIHLKFQYICAIAGCGKQWTN